MQALILKLQADVEARKQSRLDISATTRVMLVGVLLFLAAFALGGWLYQGLGAVVALLLDAAKRLEPLDPELARETYLDAVTTVMCTGSKSGGCGVRAVAEAARQAPPGPQPPRTVDLLLDGLAARFTEPYAAALPSLRRAMYALAGRDGRGDESPRWLWFVCPVTPEPLAPELWDDTTWHELATRAVRLARDAGALAVENPPLRALFAPADVLNDLMASPGAQGHLARRGRGARLPARSRGRRRRRRRRLSPRRFPAGSAGR